MIERWIPWTWLPWGFYRWLNRRHDTCWTHLVGRKLNGYDATDPDKTIFQDWICDYDTKQCGVCYCGKRRNVAD